MVLWLGMICWRSVKFRECSPVTAPAFCCSRSVSKQILCDDADCCWGKDVEGGRREGKRCSQRCHPEAAASQAAAAVAAGGAAGRLWSGSRRELLCPGSAWHRVPSRTEGNWHFSRDVVLRHDWPLSPTRVAEDPAEPGTSWSLVRLFIYRAKSLA